MGVSSKEFAERRATTVARAKERGLDGILVCGRGGGTVDRYANIFYLTNFYSSFPYIPDEPGHWRGRAHTYLLLPVTGNPALIADLPSTEGTALSADHIVVTDDVTGSVIQALEQAGLSESNIGLVGEDTIPLGHFRQLEEQLPRIRWTDAESILVAQRAHKSSTEIGLLRHASEVGSRVIEK